LLNLHSLQNIGVEEKSAVQYCDCVALLNALEGPSNELALI